jgi:hypothetical protein
MDRSCADAIIFLDEWQGAVAIVMACYRGGESVGVSPSLQFLDLSCVNGLVHL